MKTYSLLGLIMAGVLVLAGCTTTTPDTNSSVDSGSDQYTAYSEARLADAEAGDVVLFFHASWCPSCRALDQSITDNVADLPENLTILKLDYDTETELKKKYEVTFQHTLVQVDANGDMITKWSGGNTLDSLLKQVQ